MLYVTTRSNNDPYTAHRALSTNMAPDGGHYLPFKMPAFSDTEIRALAERSFNQTVADILNIFFSGGLSAWDVDFAIGKLPSRIVPMNHRIIVSELWRNPGSSMRYIIERLYAKLCAGNEAAETAGDWAKTAVWIAVLFAVYNQLVSQELIQSGDALDIAVPAEDLFIPMAAWYARSMGLPINTVICACDAGCNIWDLIHRGSLNVGSVSASMLLGIEKLINAVFGTKEAKNFADVCANRKAYNLDSESAQQLSRGFYCAVAGTGRAGATVNSVYRSNAYIMEPMTALCFSALQDYRAGTGIGHMTLLFAQKSPLDHQAQICAATGMTPAELKAQINL